MRCKIISPFIALALVSSAGCEVGSTLEEEEAQVPERVAGGGQPLLPWPAGASYYTSQGHWTGSHVGWDGWAWDFAMGPWEPVLAAHSGTVRLAKGDSSLGGCSADYAAYANYVVLDRGDGIETLYLHLASTTVWEGQWVSQGQLIGYAGQTGWSCGAHLHFKFQLSPAGGGTWGWWNQSVWGAFYDQGWAWDPPWGSWPVSANGWIARERGAGEDGHGLGDRARETDLAPRSDSAPALEHHDPHGGEGPAFDEAMRAASESFALKRYGEIAPARSAP